MTTTTQIAQIADQFAAVLREWLSEKEWIEMRVRNSEQYYSGTICASHDFCDANMAMLEAFKQVTGRDPDLAESDEDHRLWSEAWRLAKATHLTAPAKLTGDDLDAYVRAYCEENGIECDGDAFGQFIRADTPYAPHEIRALVEQAADAFHLH